MMTLFKRLCLAAVLASAIGTAGSARGGFVVAPPSKAADEGNFSVAFTSPRTIQQIYGASLLGGIPSGSVITGFSLRQTGGQPTNPATAITAANFDVRIGQSAFAPGSLGNNFASNLGSDTVLARSGPLTIAAGSYPGGASPNAFGPEIAFTTPYTYKGGDLLLTLSYTDFGSNGILPDEHQDLVGFNGVAQQIRANSYNATTATVSDNGLALIVRFTDQVVAVPEPSSMAMAAIGGLGLLGYGWCRRAWASHAMA